MGIDVQEQRISRRVGRALQNETDEHAAFTGSCRDSKKRQSFSKEKQVQGRVFDSQMNSIV